MATFSSFYVGKGKKQLLHLTLALAHRRIRSLVTGDAFDREVNSCDNLLCAGSLIRERYLKGWPQNLKELIHNVLLLDEKYKVSEELMMGRLVLVFLVCFMPLTMLIACMQSSTIEQDSNEIPELIYVHYFNEQSDKSQHELIDVVSGLDEVKQLFLELVTGEKENINLQDEQLLGFRIMIYHLSYGEEGKETSRKYYVVLRSDKGDFMREVSETTFIDQFSIEGYSRNDNKDLIKSLGNQGWYRIQLSN